MEAVELKDPQVHFTAGRIDTVANIVTLVRTVAAMTIGIIGIATAMPVLLIIGYGVYWLGDIADGWIARKLDQETRLGAVFDIISDRACTAILCAGLVEYLPAVAPTAIVFLISFMVLDTMLSLAFLCWPILSPNYFFEVDRTVYQLNWSPLAKVCNTAGVIAAIACGIYSLALGIALIVLGVKIWSAVLIGKLLSEPR